MKIENFDNIYELDSYVAKHRLPKKDNRESEYDLIALAKNGNKEAVEELIFSHLYIIVICIKKRNWNKSTVSAFDLFQSGIEIILEKAIKKFDFSKKVSFATFVFWEVRSAIDRCIGYESKTIRVPIHQYEKIKKIVNQMDLEGLESYDKVFLKVASELNFSLRESKQLLFYSQSVISLNYPVGEGLDELGNFQFSSCKSPECLVEEKDRRLKLSNIFNNLSLSKRDKEIVKMRNGMGKYRRTHTFNEVGILFNITSKRAQQIQEKNFSQVSKKVSSFGSGTWI